MIGKEVVSGSSVGPDQLHWINGCWFPGDPIIILLNRFGYNHPLRRTRESKLEAEDRFPTKKESHYYEEISYIIYLAKQAGSK